MLDKLKSNFTDWYIIARWMYSIGKEDVVGTSDAEYSFLDEYMKEKGLLPEYTNRTWSEDDCPVELLKKYGLTDSIEHVVTFKDTRSIPSITTWTALEREYGRMVGKHRMSLKKDGFNFHLVYVDGKIYKGNTRARAGSGLEFQNIDTLNIPKEISLKGNINVIGELTLTKINFFLLKDMYPKLNLVSQRASVRTALANEKAMHLLKFTAFNIQEVDDIYEEERLLKEWGFNTPEYVWVSSYEEVLEMIKKFSKMAETYEDLTDGIVIEDETKNKQRAIRLGYWEEKIYKSYVKEYEESSGEFNDIPKLVIRKILLENSSQTLIPITNWGRVIKNKLLPGSPVAFKLTSSAAPVIDLEMTSILQNQYMGRYEIYKEMIDLEEEGKLLARSRSAYL